MISVGLAASLSNKTRSMEDLRQHCKNGNLQAMQDAAVGLTKLAQEEGVHPATLAVAWVAAHPTGPSPIISARSVEQLRPSLAALDYAMEAETYSRMSALMPAPPPATDRTEESA